jgi:CBS domain
MKCCCCGNQLLLTMLLSHACQPCTPRTTGLWSSLLSVELLILLCHSAALELLVSNSVTGMPVLDDDGCVVGVVSDYDLLSLEGIAEQVSLRYSLRFPPLSCHSHATLRGIADTHLSRLNCVRAVHPCFSTAAKPIMVWAMTWL